MPTKQRYSLEAIAAARNWYNPTNYVEIIPKVPQSVEDTIKEQDERIAYKKAIIKGMNFARIRDGYNTEREIYSSPDDNIRMLSNPKAKFHTGYVSKRVLDSLSYNWGQNPNTPAEVVFGIPNRESGFGHKYRNSNEVISPWTILNNHGYFFNNPYLDDIHYFNVAYDNYNLANDYVTRDSIQNYLKDINYKNNEIKKPLYNLNISPYTWAWEWFRQGRYNPGESGYNQRVLKEGSDFINSPEFKTYWNTRGKAMYEKGKRETSPNYRQAYRDFRTGGRRSICK